MSPDYGQQFLFPPALEDWVPADHPARFIREFVEQLELPALGFAIPTAVEGHSSLCTELAVENLALRLFSSHPLDRETGRPPAPGTISRCFGSPACWFPTTIVCGVSGATHKQALRQVFKQTVQLANAHWCGGGWPLQALDGTKIKLPATAPRAGARNTWKNCWPSWTGRWKTSKAQVLAENADGDEPGYRLPAGLAEHNCLAAGDPKGAGATASRRAQPLSPGRTGGPPHESG